MTLYTTRFVSTHYGLTVSPLSIVITVGSLTAIMVLSKNRTSFHSKE